jgi:aspartate/methionine/tyrosine aminotransferase
MRHHLNVKAEELCKDLIEQESTFLVPGDCFEMSDHIRIGYGNNFDVMSEGLGRLKAYLNRTR